MGQILGAHEDRHGHAPLLSFIALLARHESLLRKHIESRLFDGHWAPMRGTALLGIVIVREPTPVGLVLSHTALHFTYHITNT